MLHDAAAMMEDGFLGVVMLDTRFPRPLGDVGHPGTFERAGIPTRHLVVEGATPTRVVLDQGRAVAVNDFVAAVQSLAAQGARLITTSCGFLARHHDALAACVSVPVLSSSLLLCRYLAHVGIVTIDAESLGHPELSGAQVPEGSPIQGVAAQSEFAQRILGNDDQLDMEQAQRDVVAAAQTLVQRAPWVQNVVLECTNMPPYREAVRAAVGRPVHDLETLVLSTWQLLQAR